MPTLRELIGLVTPADESPDERAERLKREDAERRKAKLEGRNPKKEYVAPIKTWEID